MILKYLSFSISIVFISFIVGMILTALIRKTDFYKKTLSKLNFLKSDLLNNLIGVGLVKWIVKNTFFKYLNPSLKIDRKMKLAELNNIRNQMSKAEIDHLFAFLFVIIFVILKIYKQEYIFAFVIFLVNILMNLCPTLLQQQNKRRLDKLIIRFLKSTE
ncbi:glycosyl-4,4'-diaponeurosporenoate acyltransferase CrtO family protein [Sphingobacterium faecium]|uniref:glycosyl-4,4'-diaponeurosporenoate acyltransferase CrtO family protein n=1 Tax=Sphingobacterium faecium TaxID=34087 RepID=UPI000D345014|nr:hypothetical protein [Sphingobacterium faecium]MQP28033.1 hypothetical protein [Sphingobacterium faecium]PTX09421.1 hypothetical protein C8N37_10649 [Sphingobacterium faecium]